MVGVCIRHLLKSNCCADGRFVQWTLTISAPVTQNFIKQTAAILRSHGARMTIPKGIARCWGSLPKKRPLKAE
jgi:hypothetical protein